MHIKRVLVVDDEKEWRDNVSSTLTELGFEPTVFDGFQEAERAIVKDEFPYDLIVTDNRMGDIRDAGLTLASTARLMGIDVPIIIYSSDLTYEQQARATAMKAVYVQKSSQPLNSFDRVIRDLFKNPA